MKVGDTVLYDNPELGVEPAKIISERIIVGHDVFELIFKSMNKVDRDYYYERVNTKYRTTMLIVKTSHRLIPV